ncbi:MAG TPA: phosphoglycerate dehydrogenase [Candidatus Dormibacteraeota bacterium]|nr:phosphoglycerate dehydrogenase [Candidatus Dormibacteraeota bacterium]
MSNSALRVLLLENIHPDAASTLSSSGFEVESVGHGIEEAALLPRLEGVRVLGIRSGTKVTESVLDAAPDLLAVGAFCIGTDQVDLGAASQRGVAVFNAPFSNTRSVVELALAEIIALTRRLTDRSTLMHRGMWDKSAGGSHEVRGRRLGIVGYGKIGSQLSVLGENLGMSIGFFDVADRLAMGNARRFETMHDLLGWADAITLHVDGRPGNSGLFGEAEFAAMRDGAVFLNLSRGFVVDHASLRQHIESGHLAGAAVDVFPSEPRSKAEEFVSELRGLSNVILTPHIGGSTEEAQQDIGQFVAAKLRDYVREGSSSVSVNLPNVVLEHRPGSRRLAHIHLNVPGTLAKLNAMLASCGLNIEGQLLGTQGEVGYVLTDLGGECREEVVDRLRQLPETIRLRVLG